MSADGRRLPLGAVRTETGDVVVPESRRADGSVRKPIRIRQGYVPQEEVPKYKPIGQRLREQQQQQAQTDASAAVADALDSLSLSDAPATDTVKVETDESHTTKPLKTELAAVNKSLREITRLEQFAAAAERQEEGSRPLTAAQQRKVDRRQHLEARRDSLVQQLNANTRITTAKNTSSRNSSHSSSSSKPTTLRVVEL